MIRTPHGPLAEGEDLPAPRRDTAQHVACWIASLLPQAAAVRPIAVTTGAHLSPTEPVILIGCNVFVPSSGPDWRPLERVEWEQLVAAGVPLLPWDAARVIRATRPSMAGVA